MASHPDEVRRSLIVGLQHPNVDSYQRSVPNTWRVDIERVMHTGRSLVAFGYRDGQPVVVKAALDGSDEQRAGEILDAFEGRGTVRVYEHVEGAMLLEWLRPGHSLTGMALSGGDEAATGLLADTIRSMSPRIPTARVPTVHDWGASFERYAASGDAQIPGALLAQAHTAYRRLCDSQTAVRLLHGDLHHDNVLFDNDRGWLAVDPKGVVGELEAELGAALRNPHERPDLYAAPATIETRVTQLSRELHVDATRVLSWAFAQAVLAAVWAVEDGFAVEPGWMAMARTTLSILSVRSGAIDLLRPTQ